jgi:hypothetical protein
MLKVVIPHIEMNRIARRSSLSPQLAGSETYGIKMLSFFALILRIRVRERVDAVVKNDLADFPPCISR